MQKMYARMILQTAAPMNPSGFVILRWALLWIFLTANELVHISIVQKNTAGWIQTTVTNKSFCKCLRFLLFDRLSSYKRTFSVSKDIQFDADIKKKSALYAL